MPKAPRPSGPAVSTTAMLQPAPASLASEQAQPPAGAAPPVKDIGMMTLTELKQELSKVSSLKESLLAAGMPEAATAVEVRVASIRQAMESHKPTPQLLVEATAKVRRLAQAKSKAIARVDQLKAQLSAAQTEVLEIQKSEVDAQQEEATIRQRLGPSQLAGQTAVTLTPESVGTLSSSPPHKICMCWHCAGQAGTGQLASDFADRSCCPSRWPVPCCGRRACSRPVECADSAHAVGGNSGISWHTLCPLELACERGCTPVGRSWRRHNGGLGRRVLHMTGDLSGARQAPTCGVPSSCVLSLNDQVLAHSLANASLAPSPFSPPGLLRKPRRQCPQACSPCCVQMPAPDAIATQLRSHPIALSDATHPVAAPPLFHCQRPCCRCPPCVNGSHAGSRRQCQYIAGRLLRSPLLTPQVKRCHDPWCTRVGETRVPGPPVAKRPSHQSPKREGRRNSKGPPLPATNTVLADSQESEIVDTFMSAGVDPPTPAPCLSVPAEEGPSQACGETTAYPMLFVHTVEETHLKLRFYYIHANCCWRWQTGGRGAVLSRSSRNIPLEALRAWYRHHGDHLTEESKIEVQNGLAIMEDSPHTATPPRKGASQMSLIGDIPPSQAPVAETVPVSAGMWVPPSQGACAKMFARWREWTFALN